MCDQPLTLEENVRKMIDNRKYSYLIMQTNIQRINQEMVELLNMDTSTISSGTAHKIAKKINGKATNVVQFTETLKNIDDDIREFEDLLQSDETEKGVSRNG